MKKFKLFSFALTLSIALMASFAFTPNTVAADVLSVETQGWVLTGSEFSCTELPVTVNCTTVSNPFVCKSGLQDIYKKSGTSGTYCPTPLYKL